jgi:predicted  nucleic acid-binding Zn-ribbon protein
MTDQPDANIDLVSVTKSVAETDRRRALVEDELTQAQSVVESLKARSMALSESVLDLQRSLDATKALKAREDSEVSKISEERKRAVDELTELTRTVDELRGASERDAAKIGASLEVARAQISTIESNVTKARDEAAATHDTLASLRGNVGDARRQADALEALLAQAEGTAAAVLAATKDTLDRLGGARSALDMATGRKEETEAASSALAAISNALHAKTNDAAMSMKAIDRLIADQDSQTAALADRVAAIGKLVGQPEQTNGAVEPAHPVEAPQSSEASGRFADSLYSVAVLAHARLLAQDEAEHISIELRSDLGNAVLRESWSKTVAKPQSIAHRLIFAEVLRAVGDVKAAVVYYEQAAFAKNSHPIVRYLVAIAYMKMDLLDRGTHVTQALARDRGGRTLSRILEALRLDQSGRSDDAVVALTDIVATKGLPKWEYDETLRQLGKLHERNHNEHAALSCYEQIEASGPGLVDARGLIRALRHQAV